MNDPEKVWCEHIAWKQNGFGYGWLGPQSWMTDEDKWCSRCGKPRPDPEKTELWEIFEQMQREGSVVSYVGHEEELKNWCKRLASAAERWFNEQQKEK